MNACVPSATNSTSQHARGAAKLYQRTAFGLKTWAT
jgi:hypothetical protein